MIFGSPPIVTSGLVLNLDAGNTKSYPRSGTVWRDLSGNNNSGSLVNGPTYNSQNGGSIVFDGVDDYVDLGLVTQLTNITNVSVNAWIYPITSSNTAYVSRYSNTTPSNGWLLASYAGSTGNSVKFVFDGRESFAQYINSTSSIEYPINTWYNVTTTKSSSIWNVYVNGSLAGSLVTGSGTTVFSNNNMQIGAIPHFSLYSKSRVATTQIYNRALTPTEIIQNYNAQKSRFNLQ